jgi:hypothetical protein
MKKKWFLLSLISLSFSIPYALADIGQTLGNVWWKFMSVGSLGFLGLAEGSVVIAFTRILLWIFMFTVFFALTTFLGGDDGSLKFLKRNHAIVISFVIATIGAIFLPVQTILAVGAGWGTLISLILVGGPIVGIGYLLWYLPGKDASGAPKPDTKGTVALKIIICLLLLWVLSVMKYHVGRMI